MITLSNISKSFGSRTLFENVNITFNGGQRYGLTGPNGCGKSTLLKIIMGIESSSTGTVSLPDKVGILRQNIEEFSEFSVVDTVIMGNERLWKAMEERDRLYEGEITDEVGMRLGELEGIVAEEDGYSAEASAEILLNGMGIESSFLEEKMGTIPTDLQFRVLLCQALFGEPEALLLDEPTNHLDLESIGWLEKFLLNFRGAMVVISHDRHFLNSVCTDIADIDYDTIISYPGNYDSMFVAKTATRQRAESEARSKENKIAKLQEFVSRFSAGSRASQVQSRMREISRLQPKDLKASNIQRPYIRFPIMEKQPGKIIFRIQDICKAYDGPNVIDHFSFEIERGDKIAVIGNNGAGKTTLLKMLAQQIAPDTGSIEIGHNTEIAYFPQNHSEIIAEEETANAFEWLKERRSSVYDQDVRSAMGKMLFGGDDAFKKVRTLSGGETARMILAGIILQEHNVIIMDEPNNHLDLEAVSALSWGLEDYKGTVIVASHDRDLLSGVANKVIAIENNQIHYYQGSLEEYLETQKSKV